MNRYDTNTVMEKQKQTNKKNTYQLGVWHPHYFLLWCWRVWRLRPPLLRWWRVLVWCSSSSVWSLLSPAWHVELESTACNTHVICWLWKHLWWFRDWKTGVNLKKKLSYNQLFNIIKYCLETFWSSVFWPQSWFESDLILIIIKTITEMLIKYASESFKYWSS